jgi:hypothetical protein
MTRRSVASTHRLGALKDNGRLGLQARMYSADDGAAGRVNVGGGDKRVRKRR